MFYDGHPARRAGRGRVPRRAVVPALRQLRDPRRARRRRRCCSTLADFTHRARTSPSSARRRPTTYAALVRRGLPAHRAHGRALDARRLRARRDEHRQHVDPRADDRLRPVRLARGLRPRLDAEHHRRRRPPLSLRPTSRASRSGTCARFGERAAAADRQPSSRCEAALEALRARRSSGSTRTMLPTSSACACTRERDELRRRAVPAVLQADARPT